MSYHNVVRSNLANQELAEAVTAGKRILDVGGGIQPWYAANHIIDIQPFDTDRLHKTAWGGTRSIPWTSQNYTQHDICGGAWPLADHSFDLGYAGGIMEDLRDPIFAIREMQRICRRVIIDGPNRLCEQIRGFEHQRWCGMWHHRWMISAIDGTLMLQGKTPLLNLPRCHHRLWPWQRLNPAELSFAFIADAPFSVREVAFWSDSAQREDLTAFVARSKLPQSAFEWDWRRVVYKFRQLLFGAF